MKISFRKIGMIRNQLAKMCAMQSCSAKSSCLHTVGAGEPHSNRRLQFRPFRLRFSHCTPGS